MAEKTFFKIIIPNYNNMPYIKKCLDSILEQTFQDFKIIIVDDMSTDLSDKFCEMYARKHPDKITFIRMSYKGHEGGCRNIGIGYPIFSKFTYFVDGDDYLYDKYVLDKIYNVIQSSKYDIYLVNMVQLTLDNKIIPNGDFNQHFLISNLYMSLSRWNSASAKFIRSSILEYFLEQCDHGADAFQWYKQLNKTTNIFETDIIVYVYRRNYNSLTLNKDSKYVEHTKLFYNKLKQLILSITNKDVKKSLEFRIKLYESGKITK